MTRLAMAAAVATLAGLPAIGMSPARAQYPGPCYYPPAAALPPPAPVPHVFVGSSYSFYQPNVYVPPVQVPFGYPYAGPYTSFSSPGYYYQGSVELYRSRYPDPGPYYYTRTYPYTPTYYGYYYTPGYFRY
jgi:hypothetical protein